MKLQLVKASTNVTVYVFVQDSSATTGAGLTGLVWNSAGLVASQVRPLAARVAITLATQTVTGAHSDGGFVEVDSTNMPGVYRLDLPDAVCATGVGSVVVMLKGATNMAPVVLEIQLVSVDLNDAVRGGMSALPNAAADAAGGLPISDAGGLDLDTQLAATNEVTAARMGALTDWINGGRLDLLLDAIKVVTDTQAADGSGLTAMPWNAAWDAEVESEVNDALDTAISELGVAAPTATPTLRTGLMLLYMALRNKTVVQTSGTDALEIYNDAGTKIAAKLLTDDGSDYVEAEMA